VWKNQRAVFLLLAFVVDTFAIADSISEAIHAGSTAFWLPEETLSDPTFPKLALKRLFNLLNDFKRCLSCQDWHLLFLFLHSYLVEHLAWGLWSFTSLFFFLL